MTKALHSCGLTLENIFMCAEDKQSLHFANMMPPDKFILTILSDTLSPGFQQFVNLSCKVWLLVGKSGDGVCDCDIINALDYS